MWLEFSHPLLLLLIPLCALAVHLIARRYPSKSKKARISHILRHALILLTVLALAGMSVRSGSSDKAAWILVDASASAAGRPEEASRLVNEALASIEDERQTGVIVFGKNAMVEVPLSDAPEFSGVTTAVNASGSDLSQALALAGALLPSDASGGIAVISDGLIAEIDASSLQSRGISVNALKIEPTTSGDAQVTKVELPGTAYQGQKISVTVTVHSTSESSATLILSANRMTTAARDVTLRKGENTFVFQDVAANPGVVTYEAQIIMPGDGVSQNDRTGAYVTVSGAPSVLIVEGQTGAGGELAKMLRAAGMTVEIVSPAMLSESAASLRAFHAVALANVDADTLSDGQISALDSSVRELGVGVAVFGGDSSYALGGYRGSALERMLPVTIDVKNRLELPSTALVLVIDKSGSMTDGQYGVTRLEVAKEAACRAIEALSEQDQAGVIAFDDQGKWVVPLSQVTDVAAMQAQIGTIRPGGGTAFYTPLAMAFDALTHTTAQHKHVIFLTDGQSGDTGYDGIAASMAEQGITLTTVAVGSGADTATMLRLATLGGGRAYAAGEFDNVPKIFTKETLLAAGTYVQNRTFTPIVTDESLTGFSGFPVLDGYLATSEKALATVSLVSDREDPILAWWQYGAGRVLCWTSDVQGAWSSSFLAWDDAAAFFGGLISHILPVHEQSGEMKLENGVLTYISDAPQDGTSVSAQAILPDGTAQSLALEQVSPTRYEAALDTGSPGAYAVQISMTKDGEAVAHLDGGTVVPYAQEYDLRSTDLGALEKLSSDTGGSIVDSPAELLNFPFSAVQARRPLKPWLLSAALVLLILDVAQQRLNWERILPKHEPSAQPEPGKPRPPKREKKQPPPKADPTKTSEQLWQSLQKKQRL